MERVEVVGLALPGFGIISNTSGEVPDEFQALAASQQTYCQCLQVKPQVLSSMPRSQAEVQVEAIDVGGDAGHGVSPACTAV
ncbi:hypothetical protein [Actinophytocola sp.]|uniref:hypothetical protein n=1 Tax=Actinophytocola sp. TaxID=1872138 RepID=UPI00389AAEF9